MDEGGEESTTAPITELLVRLGTGDQEAFPELYGAVVRPVFDLARGVVRDPAQAEEVTQEVMAEVWANSPRYNPTLGSPLAWILAITRCRAVDRVRSEQASRRRNETIAAREITAWPDTAIEAVERSSDQERVRAALDELTNLQREAIHLAFFEGYSHSQIANTLRAPIGTIKTRIRDGLLKLRPALEDPP